MSPTRRRRLFLGTVVAINLAICGLAALGRLWLQDGSEVYSFDSYIQFLSIEDLFRHVFSLQGYLLAVWAVFPNRSPLLRSLVSISILVLLQCATGALEPYTSSGPMHLSSFRLVYTSAISIGAICMYLLVRHLNQWRIVDIAEWPQQANRTFSLRGILGAVTLAAVALAASRARIQALASGGAPQYFATILLLMTVSGMIGAAARIPILLVALAPSVRKRWIVTAFVIGVLHTLPDFPWTLIADLLFLGSLLLVRCAGYRLVKLPGKSIAATPVLSTPPAGI